MNQYIGAGEAAERLGVTKATLYAYTSRGLLRSEPVPDRPRERRYYREDVQRLKDRKETRRNPAREAERGLHWGSPVLESAITLIEGGKLYYRGQDAMELAEHASLEQVARLLWSVESNGREQLFDEASPLEARQVESLRRWAPKSALALLEMALPVAGTADLKAYDLRPPAVRQTGARILRMFATLIAGRSSIVPIHEALEVAWSSKGSAIADAIRTALVLCADHELNISAFVARCAASAAASPYDVVSAAMSTLKGHRHGGATERVSALFREIASGGDAQRVLAGRLRRGEGLPGFGHPLYPSGDPRATLLLKLAEASAKKKERRLMLQIAEAGSELLDDLPNLDFGLVALSRACGFPADAPLLLFALGRTAGWIGHAIEQYASSGLIRPRARYVGPAPRGPHQVNTASAGS